MIFGADYHPEHWVYPYAGTPEEPEARWEQDAALMAAAGINAVRLGEFSWGICEPQEGTYDFAWLRRAMDVMGRYGIRVVLGTPTAAPPLWLARKHPEILPLDENGLPLHEGTRHACCLNCDIFWQYSRKIVTAMAEALGNHPQLLAWQIDNGIGGHTTEFCYNEATRRDWHQWLESKYETIEKLNQCLGTRFWGQVVTAWDQVPMPMRAPTVHNPALLLDWMRFSSDTIVAFVKMQADLLHELTPKAPVTTNIRVFARHYDHFDMADTLDFAAMDSFATDKARAALNACEVDFMRSLKRSGKRLPEDDLGFWVIEQKAGQVNWQEVNSLLRPETTRLFTYQFVSRGADAVFYFYWRQPRIGSEQFYGGVLTHDGRGDNRVYREVAQVGEELQRLAPLLKGTRVVADTCILYSHPNEWVQKLPLQPTRHFHQHDHLMLYFSALHDRNIPVDFARPEDDLSAYRLVIAPSLRLLSGYEADHLREYVANGGTLVCTCNSGLLDEHHIAADNGFPHDLTDVFGLEVQEFDPIAPGNDNHLSFRGAFATSALHPAQLWCDIIEAKGCQVLATYARDFYAGRPAITMNSFGKGHAIYVGTVSHQAFYYDLITWLRGLVGIHPILKAPEMVEVSLRESATMRIYFLLNHQNTAVRITFYKPAHDFLTGRIISGNFDLPPYGVLVLDEPVNHAEGPA
jgi:beta-galactosidase